MATKHRGEEQLTDGGAQAAGWKNWQCPGDVCEGKVWSVRAMVGVEGLWLVGEAPEEGTWLVAATVPRCPLCGDTLQEVEAAPEPNLGPFAALLADLGAQVRGRPDAG